MSKPTAAKTMLDLRRVNLTLRKHLVKAMTDIARLEKENKETKGEK